MCSVWLPPLGRRPRVPRGRGTQQAVGRPAHPGVARARLGDWGRVPGGKHWGQLSPDQLAGGAVWRRILAHSPVDTLLISIKL